MLRFDCGVQAIGSSPRRLRKNMAADRRKDIRPVKCSGNRTLVDIQRVKRKHIVMKY